MFWFWVAVVLVLVLAAAAWSSHRAKKVHDQRAVRADGPTSRPHPGMGESTDAQAEFARGQSTRGDQQITGG